MSWKERQAIELRISWLVKHGNATNDDDLKANLSRFICVLASGYLEAACRDIFGKYVERRSNVSVHRFVMIKLKRYQNLNAEKLLQLASAFNTEARERIERVVRPDWKDAVDSIVANRHNIVHGRDSGVSLVVVQNYFERAKRFMACFEREFNI